MIKNAKSKSSILWRSWLNYAEEPADSEHVIKVINSVEILKSTVYIQNKCFQSVNVYQEKNSIIIIEWLLLN